MMITIVKDYETAFNFLLDWLKETRDMTRASIDDSDDEVQFAMANGYLNCCRSAIVIAETIKRELSKNRGEKND